MTRNIVRIVLAGWWVLAILAISAPVARAEAPARTPGAAAFEGFTATHPPKPAPITPFLDGSGTEKTLADWKGQVVVLNFWAIWCAPCVRELPSLERMSAKLAPEGLGVIALSLDRGGASAVKNFFEGKDIKLPIHTDEGRRLVRETGVKGLPTTLIIDRQGQEVARLIGPAEWDSPEVIAVLRTYLGAK